MTGHTLNSVGRVWHGLFWGAKGEVHFPQRRKGGRQNKNSSLMLSKLELASSFLHLFPFVPK